MLFFTLSETQEETHFQFYREFKKHPVHWDTKGFLRAHAHSSIHTHTNNLKNKINKLILNIQENIQVETKSDGYNYEKHDVLYNYRLLICDWRLHSRDDRQESLIYYEGFGLISLQIFVTTTKFCLKTFPLSLLGCGGGSRRRFRDFWFQKHSSWTRAFPSTPSQSFIHTHTDAYVHQRSQRQGISDTYQTSEREWEYFSLFIGSHSWNTSRIDSCVNHS